MTFLSRGKPGVEWSEFAGDARPTSDHPGRSFEPYPTSCAACGGEIAIEGYCQQCGQKARNLREHFELSPAPWLAGVCDIGRVHARNEDALAIRAEGTRAVLVVCDGVTTSEDSDVASLAAAETACEQLWASNPRGTGTASSRLAAIEAVLDRAIEAANQAVIDSTSPDSLNAAATTIALAVIDGTTLACASLGDSRVYWLPDDGEPIQVTKDHSLAQDEIDSGIPRIEAESSLLAHTITKWLGRDAVDLNPDAVIIETSSPGWLIVCSDGLWNYVSEAAALRELVIRFNAEDASPQQLAASLVGWANEQGGHDNVTVACARLSEETDQGSARSSTDPGEDDPDAPTVVIADH